MTAVGVGRTRNTQESASGRADPDADSYLLNTATMLSPARCKLARSLAARTVLLQRRHLSALPPTIRHILALPPSAVPLEARGWVRSVRKQKNVAFAVVADGSAARGLQVVMSPEQAKK